MKTAIFLLKTSFLILMLILLGGCKAKSTISNSNNTTPKDAGEKAFDEYLSYKTSKMKGSSLPDFKLQTLDGKEVTKESLKGKIVLLNFWFSACKPCRTEVPSLNQLQKDFGEKGVYILAAGLDSETVSQNFANSQGVLYDILPNAKELAKLLEISNYPTTVLLNAEGIVQEVFIGASDFDATATYSEIKPHLLKLLSK